MGEQGELHRRGEDQSVYRNGYKARKVAIGVGTLHV